MNVFEGIKAIYKIPKRSKLHLEVAEQIGKICTVRAITTANRYTVIRWAKAAGIAPMDVMRIQNGNRSYWIIRWEGTPYEA